MREEGAIANKYQFAGEQFDANLGDYYLRQRYYSSRTGRFARRDDYEGRLHEPITLHKYLYAYGAPSNYTDPSGRDVREGDIIHEKIGRNFVRQIGEDPFTDNNPFTSSRVYDPRIPSQGRQRPTMLRIFRRELNNQRHPGVRGVNRLVPDLVDFNDGELYEIKQNKQADITAARNNLTRQVDALHQLRLTRWHRGDDYNPPPIIPLSWISEDWGRNLAPGGLSDARQGRFAIVRRIEPGLITYNVLNPRLDLFLSAYAAYEIAKVIAQYVQLLALTRGLA